MADCTSTTIRTNATRRGILGLTASVVAAGAAAAAPLPVLTANPDAALLRLGKTAARLSASLREMAEAELDGSTRRLPAEQAERATDKHLKLWDILSSLTNRIAAIRPETSEGARVHRELIRFWQWYYHESVEGDLDTVCDPELVFVWKLSCSLIEEA